LLKWFNRISILKNEITNIEMMRSKIIFCVVVFLFFAISSCHKSMSNGNNGGTGTDTTIVPPNDPAFSATVGFFGNDWAAKTFAAPSFTITAKPTASVDAFVSVDMSNVITKVSKYLFGNNTNMWTGQMSNQASLICYIKDLSPNVLRGPGGSASDIYFWNANFQHLPTDVTATLYDGNGNSVKTDSTNYWYGQNTPYWSLALDDFYSSLQTTNTATGLITVNYAYARYGTGPTPVQTAAHLAADWVRYDNGRTKYWEVGNECYGTWEACYKIDVTKNQDGQPAILTGDLYGQQFKVFYDSMKVAAQQIGATIFIGAPILDYAPASWETSTTQTWNQGVLNEVGSVADFFIVHDYFTAYNTNSSATDILNSATTVPAAAMAFVKSQFTQYAVPVKPVALSEWNIQATGSKQNVSNVAGIHAVVTLAELIRNQFGEASRWDIANGWSNGDDQGMFNIGDEPGAVKWNPRPVFYHLYYFQKYFGDRMVNATVIGDASILSYASSFSSGQSGIIVINESTANKTVDITIKNFRAGANYYWYTLAGGTGSGDFPGSVYINGNAPSGATGGPLNYAGIQANGASQTGGIAISAPARSVTFVVADVK
jgi:hypothetical protein